MLPLHPSSTTPFSPAPSSHLNLSQWQSEVELSIDSSMGNRPSASVQALQVAHQEAWEKHKAFKRKSTKEEEEGSWIDFPPEIKLFILSFLDVKSLCTFACVNWRFNLLAETDVLWKELYLRKFLVHKESEEIQGSWKSAFKHEYLFAGVFSDKQKGPYLQLSNNNETVSIHGPGWTSVMVGRELPCHRGQHYEYTFRMDTRSEGMMIAMSNQFDYYKDKYPGSGNHGITVGQHNSEAGKVFSIAFYESRRKGDKIKITIDFKSWDVQFTIMSDRGDVIFNGSHEIAPEFRKIDAARPSGWCVLVSLCSLDERVTVLRD